MQTRRGRRKERKSPGHMSGALHVSVYARRNRADHVVIRTGLARISAAAAGRAVRVGADIGGGRGRACGRVLQALIRSRMMLRRKSRRGEQRNAQRGQNQLGAEGFHFFSLRLRSPLAAYVHWILRCTSLLGSPACHDIVSQIQLVNGNITAAPSLFILRCNKRKNEADKFLSLHKGLRANVQYLPLSAARNARAAVKSLYLPEGNS